MKLIYLITKGNWGGAQKYVYDLASEAGARQFEVLVAVGQGEALAQKLQAAKIRTTPIAGLNRDISFLADVKTFFKLIKLFRTEKPDIIHLNSSKIGGVGALAGRLSGVKKIIFTAHGWPFWEKNRGIIWRVMAWSGSWATILLAHQIICISKYDLAIAQKISFNKKKIHLIYNGIGNLNFLSREEARQELGIALGNKVIGSIGELTANKNYSQLLKAAEKLWRENYDFDLVIIGDGEDKSKLKSERLFLPGFKPEAYKYLKAFDIFALPSLKEGLPYVLLEAGLANLPVVASNVGGIPDIITNKVSGLLIDPQNTNSLTSALSELLTNETQTQTYGHTLAQTVSAKFSKTKMIEETFKLYN